jgi:hypothetical protein
MSASPAEHAPPYVRLGDPRQRRRPLPPRRASGDSFEGPDGTVWTMSAHLDAGNKLAAVPIAQGERIIKVGVPIGTATHPIESGEHVHSHNLRSDYIPIDGEEDGMGGARAFD